MGTRISSDNRKAILFINNPRKKRRKPKLDAKTFLWQKTWQLRKKPTAAEFDMCKKLESIKMPYVFQYNFVMKERNREILKAIMDFYLPTMNVFVEVDGEYHSSPDQKQNDAIKDWLCLKKFNKKVIRLTNEQVLDMTAEQIIATIQAA